MRSVARGRIDDTLRPALKVTVPLRTVNSSWSSAVCSHHHVDGSELSARTPERIPCRIRWSWTVGPEDRWR
jgi:hypothetical protein